MRRFRAGLFAAAVAATLAAAATPASAHVSVSPSEAPSGSFTVLTFRVPNERADAGTVKVEVEFPVEHPIAFVSVRPVPGWTYMVERRQLDKPVEAEGTRVSQVVSRIVWSGGPIRPGEFQEFAVSAGPLPEGTGELVFKALQTYETGEVVRWIEPPGPGGEEPEHPAPVLRLGAPVDDADHHHGDATTTTSVEHEEAGGTPVAASEPAGDDGDGLAVAGVVLGALALVVAAAALASTRRVRRA